LRPLTTLGWRLPLPTLRPLSSLGGRLLLAALRPLSSLGGRLRLAALRPLTTLGWRLLLRRLLAGRLRGGVFGRPGLTPAPLAVLSVLGVFGFCRH
jgi:hypothetical protein